MFEVAIDAKSEKVFGTFWSHETEFAVLDIDSNSPYHTPTAAQELLNKLAAVGLSKCLLFQSSGSQGWHLYLPFTSKISSLEVEQSLKRFLKLSGYSLKCGQLEVFPSGNALRLPLQRGFAWLSQTFEVLVTRESLTTQQACDYFLAAFEANKNDWKKAKDALEEFFALHESNIDTDGFDGLFNSRIITENYEKGRQFWQAGLREVNQRHEAILCVEHYLWHGDSEIGLPAYPGRFNDNIRYGLILAWLKEKHNGLSGHVLRGNWREIELDIERAVRWRAAGKTKSMESYPCTERALETLESRSRRTGRVWTMDDLKKGNERREAQARQKIRSAVASMRLAGEQLTRNGIARFSGCSPNTVKKHSDLWNEFLASRSSDQSRGVGGSSVVLVTAKPEIEPGLARCSFPSSPVFLIPPVDSSFAPAKPLVFTLFRSLFDAGGCS